ncbi:anti-repressor SinI family protein [Neobacillus sp. PS3-12]|nr:anti-repressor SinI family protein [Neobacillus sp. PS3-12]WML51623.1 anti-repressor SinI family protein [Neobacillus sp. PS3-12]
MTTDVNEKELDKEWLDLMIEARKLGISIDEIKEFLNKNCQKA